MVITLTFLRKIDINRFPTNRSLTTDDLSARLLPLKIVLSRFNPDIMKIQANTNSGSIRMSVYFYLCTPFEARRKLSFGQKIKNFQTPPIFGQFYIIEFDFWNPITLERIVRFSNFFSFWSSFQKIYNFFLAFCSLSLL